MPVNELNSLVLDIGAATDIGNVRELNEDAVLAEMSPALSITGEPAAVLLAADGVGGHQAGEVASGMAADAVRQIIVAGDHSRLDGRPATTIPDLLTSIVEHVNETIYSYNLTQATGNSATTFTLCLITNNRFDIVHVGDTRAYLIHDGGISQLTEDDSFVADAVRRGQMTEEEARNSPFRNQITKSVGNNSGVTPTLYSGTWDSRDILLVCTDGLTEYVSTTDIVEAACSGEPMSAICLRLANMARAAGGHDNISLAAAFNGPTPPAKLTAEIPAVSSQSPSKPAPPTRDPNRLLRPILLIFIALAAAVIGLAVARTGSHNQQGPVIAPIGTPPPPPTPVTPEKKPLKHRRVHTIVRKIQEIENPDQVDTDRTNAPDNAAVADRQRQSNDTDTPHQQVHHRPKRHGALSKSVEIPGGPTVTVVDEPVKQRGGKNTSATITVTVSTAHTSAKSHPTAKPAVDNSAADVSPKTKKSTGAPISKDAPKTGTGSSKPS